MIKNLLFLLAFAFVLGSTGASAQKTDTVWSRNIWPENVERAMFSLDGTKLYVSTDARVWIFNTLTGDTIRTVSGVGSFVAQSSDGLYIYTNGVYKLDAITYEKIDSIKTFLLDSIQALGVSDFHLANIVLTPDNKRLIFTGDVSGVPQQNYNVGVADAETMKILKNINYLGGIGNLTVSPDGNNFVTGWGDGIYNSQSKIVKLLLWDANTYEIISTLAMDTINISQLKFSPNGKMLCEVIAGGFNIFDMDSLKLIKNYAGTYQNGGVRVLTFSPNSNYIIWGSGSPLSHNNTTKIADINTLDITYTYPVPYCAFNAIDISQNSKYIIAGISNDLYLLNSQDGISGVNELINQGLLINNKPNPSNKEPTGYIISKSSNKLFTIKSNCNNFASCRLYNFFRNLLPNENILSLNDNGNISINPAQLNTGVYFLAVGMERVVKVLVVE
jgi:hypothetical protein